MASAGNGTSMLNRVQTLISSAAKTVIKPVVGGDDTRAEAARKGAATRRAAADKRKRSAQRAAETRKKNAARRSASAKRAATTRKQRDARVEAMVEATRRD